MRSTIDTRFFIVHYVADANDLKLQTKRKMIELQEERAIVPTIVLHEVYKTYADIAGIDVADLRVNFILNSNFTVIDLTPDIAILSAQLRNKYRSLPTADAIIAATAIKSQTNRVFSDDPHFKTIKEIKTQWL
ncbi:MAG: PIN domain-containing protein [Nitrososphaerales archaeon]